MKISEKKLNKIIKESVDKVLNETSRRQKAMQAIKGKSNNIKTCAILTAFNPMTKNLPLDYNRRLNQKLMVYLKTGNFVWFPVKGHYDGLEESFIIYNISLDDALHIGEKFEQESVIFVDNRGEDISYQYWEQTGKGDFRLTHERNTYLDMEDATDFFTEVSRKFKFQIPFFDGNDNTEEPVLSEHNIIIGKALNENVKKGKYDIRLINEKIDKMVNGNSMSGRSKYDARGNIYGGYQKHIDQE